MLQVGKLELDCKGTVIAVGGSQRFFFDFGSVINLPETVGSDGQSIPSYTEKKVVAVFVLAFLADFIGR